MTNIKMPNIAEMDEILEKEERMGVRGIRLFVRDGSDITTDDVARGYCQLCKAEEGGNFTNVTGEVL